MPVRCRRVQVSVVRSGAALMDSMTAPLLVRRVFVSAKEVAPGLWRGAHVAGCAGYRAALAVAMMRPTRMRMSTAMVLGEVGGSESGSAIFMRIEGGGDY